MEEPTTNDAIRQSGANPLSGQDQSPSFVVFEGKVQERTQLPAEWGERAFRFGDALFETMRVCKGTPLFFLRHYSRLILGMDALGYAIPEHWQPSWLRDQVLALLDKTGYVNARIRITVWRAGGGLYAPQTDSVSWMVEAWPLEEPFYGINRDGLQLGIADSISLSRRPLDAVKSANALPYVMAARERGLGPFDELILVNDEGRAVEATSSNLFVFMQGRLVTPPPSEGGIPGIMRGVILHVAKKAGINVAQEPLSLADVERADEIFLTNAMHGMRWVARFRAKRYPNQFAVGLFGKLEEKVLAELTRPWPPR